MTDDSSRLYCEVFKNDHRTPDWSTVAVLADSLEDQADTELRVGLRFLLRHRVWPRYFRIPNVCEGFEFPELTKPLVAATVLWLARASATTINHLEVRWQLFHSPREAVERVGAVLLMSEELRGIL